jgi:hypothetical protein
LEKEIVKVVAENLMIQYGSTTTLDIKNRLREKQYFALQTDVSALMDEISTEEGWEYDDNGIYRTYYATTDLQALLAKINFSLN